MSSAMRPVWPIYRRLLGYTRRYWVFLSAALAGMLVEATAGYGFVRLMDPLVNRGFVNPERQMAVFLPLAIVGLFVLRSLATFVVDYGRPLARGRTLLGSVIPYGRVWRTGANAATQFTTSAPITL